MCMFNVFLTVNVQNSEENAVSHDKVSFPFWLMFIFTVMTGSDYDVKTS